VDVTAFQQVPIDNSFVGIGMVIECKYAKQRPWIVLRSTEQLDKYAFFSRVLQGRHPSEWKEINTLQGRLVGRIVLSLDQTKLEPFLLKRTGYAVMESRPGDESSKSDLNQKDNAYEAITQIRKSIESHDGENEEIFKSIIRSFEEGDRESLSLLFSVAFPTIVINGVLFEGYLDKDKDNEIQVSQTEESVVLVPYSPSVSFQQPHVVLSPVTIVTEAHLPNYISKMQNAIRGLINQTDAVKEVIAYERSKIRRTYPKELDF
jgi:hypothetical protein